MGLCTSLHLRMMRTGNRTGAPHAVVVVAAAWMALLSHAAVNGAAAPRVCQTPDCLLAETVQLAREVGITEEEARTNLYVWVPPGTRSFTLGVYDQPDDTPAAKPSRFMLTGPGGTSRVLDHPQAGAWVEYAVETGENWGAWRLSIDPPEGPAEVGKPPAKARNYFMVRTTGDVDLYFQPPASVRARGLRLAPPRFGGGATHRFYAQNSGHPRVRVQLMRGRDAASNEVRLDAPGGTQKRGGLGRGGVEYLEVTEGKAGLWGLTVEPVREPYALGTEQGLRLFCMPAPLMPMPRRVPVSAVLAGKSVPARLELAAPQLETERPLVFAGAAGPGTLELPPGVSGQITASAGFENSTGTAAVTTESAAVEVPLTRRLTRPAGWYCGDNHTHTTYYDGGSTPAQVVEAARAAGLDWVAITEHAQENRTRSALPQVRKALEEAKSGNDPGRFVVVEGMEFTTQAYHANVLNGAVDLPATASLQALIDAVRQQNDATLKLNHPTLGGGQAAELARSAENLPLLELWNSSEPKATQLWWELLNAGKHVFAETSSDSHSRRTAPPGHRRTYVYLGQEPLQPTAIVRALREGRSFLSRDALIDFRINGRRPGERLAAAPLKVTLSVDSADPVERVEIIRGGKLVHSFAASGQRRLDVSAELPAEPGWYLAQVIPTGRERLPLALTNPIFIEKAGP